MSLICRIHLDLVCILANFRELIICFKVFCAKEIHLNIFEVHRLHSHRASSYRCANTVSLLPVKWIIKNTKWLLFSVFTDQSINAMYKMSFNECRTPSIDQGCQNFMMKWLLGLYAFTSHMLVYSTMDNCLVGKFRSPTLTTGKRRQSSSCYRTLRTNWTRPNSLN